MIALPPRRRLYEMLGIQRASSRLATYFGKFEKRRAPKIGTSNMLWWLAMTRYGFHPSTADDRSTSSLVPQSRNTPINVFCHRPTTISWGRGPKSPEIRWRGSKSPSVRPNAIRKGTVKTQSTKARMPRSRRAPSARGSLRDQRGEALEDRFERPLITLLRPRVARPHLQPAELDGIGLVAELPGRDLDDRAILRRKRAQVLGLHLLEEALLEVDFHGGRESRVRGGDAIVSAT